MSRVIDLAGRQFDRLTVVRRASDRRTPGGQLLVYWECVCSCGVTTEATSQNLRLGKVRSCGCLSVDSARSRYRDLAGERFGRLVAIRRDETLDDGTTTWFCDCDCGKQRTVRTSLLTSGSTMSCGCLNSILSVTRRWTGDDVRYLAMHDRLRAARGVARTHSCVDCGGVARDWSYDGGDPNVRYEVVNGYRLAFSTNLDRYSPRCSPCHRSHDAAARKEVSA